VAGVEGRRKGSLSLSKERVSPSYRGVSHTTSEDAARGLRTCTRGQEGDAQPLKLSKLAQLGGDGATDPGMTTTWQRKAKVPVHRPPATIHVSKGVRRWLDEGSNTSMVHTHVHKYGELGHLGG
jgi:hypothetical protein